MTNASNTLIALKTQFGTVSISPETYDVVAACYRGRKAVLEGMMTSDIRLLRNGLDVEELRKECCHGTNPKSAEESAWSDWVDAAKAAADA